MPIVSIPRGSTESMIADLDSVIDCTQRLPEENVGSLTVHTPAVDFDRRTPTYTELGYWPSPAEGLTRDEMVAALQSLKDRLQDCPC